MGKIPKCNTVCIGTKPTLYLFIRMFLSVMVRKTCCTSGEEQNDIMGALSGRMVVEIQ